MKYPTTLCASATVGTIRGDNSIGYAKLRNRSHPYVDPLLDDAAEMVRKKTPLRPEFQRVMVLPSFTDC